MENGNDTIKHPEKKDADDSMRNVEGRTVIIDFNDLISSFDALISSSGLKETEEDVDIIPENTHKKLFSSFDEDDDSDDKKKVWDYGSVTADSITSSHSRLYASHLTPYASLVLNQDYCTSLPCGTSTSPGCY
jgi:hypothetical protein